MTEEVTGVDLVEWMLRLAAGEDLELEAPPGPRVLHPSAAVCRGPGATISDPRPACSRMRALPPMRGSKPGSRTAPRSRPSTIRLLAKIITVGEDRAAALSRMREALRSHRDRRHRDQSRLLAPTDRRPAVCGRRHDHAGAGCASPTRRARSRYWRPERRPRFRTIRGGVGYWNVGVPPSGPMDDLSFRLAQSRAGQSAECGRARDHGVGPDAQVQHRRHRLPHGRTDAGRHRRPGASSRRALRRTPR